MNRDSVSDPDSESQQGGREPSDRIHFQPMRIATWNVNGLRARLDFLIHWLRARQPDIVGLQELKASEEEFPYEELEKEGYRALAHTQKAWNGVAILSRREGKLVSRGLAGQEDQGARLITAEFDQLVFSTLYCPNGKAVGHGDFFRKLSWLDSLAEQVEAQCRSGVPLVVCGDFNVCPGPLDSWNEEALRGRIFHTEQERSRLQRLFDWGLLDAFRQLNPQTRAYSWWDYRGGAFHKNEGLRIDLLLATRPVLERIRSVEIDREYRKKKEGLITSDHAPVMAQGDL